MGILTHDGGLSYVVDVVLSMLWEFRGRISQLSEISVLAKTKGPCAT